MPPLIFREFGGDFENLVEKISEVPGVKYNRIERDRNAGEITYTINGKQYRIFLEQCGKTSRVSISAWSENFRPEDYPDDPLANVLIASSCLNQQ